VSPALDACPGVLTLHPARDGLVARIRLPGGYASATRWRALARLSAEFGDGGIDLTARGNVQLRGLREADAEALAAAAFAAGLLPSAEHDRARNITASPLAGLGGRPALRDLVDALDAALLTGPEFAALPGRFLFALDDGSGGASLASSDLGLSHAAGGFDLFVAGRHTGVRVPAAEAVAAVLAATRAALAAGVGDSVTRIAALADDGQSLAAAVGGALGAAAGPDSRLSLGASSRGAAVVVAARLGRLTGDQVATIAGLVAPGEVARVGIAGRLVIPVASAAGAALARLAGCGLIVDADDPMGDVTACSGAACHRSLADVRGAARPVSEYRKTHWAGCERRCGCPPDAEPVVALDATRYRMPGEGAA
jgi:precorrin-3B synthase